MLQEQQSKMLTEGLDSARREVPQLMQVELISYFRELCISGHFLRTISANIESDYSKMKSITVEIKALCNASLKNLMFQVLFFVLMFV